MFKSQVAIVTGGGRGIGRAVSLKLAEKGAYVLVNYSRSAREAQEVVDLIQKVGGCAAAVQFDVANSAAVDEAIKSIIEQHGRVDILVNNAGITSDSLLVRAKDSDWQRTIDVNLSGCFYCARAVGKSMMKARSGRIINISSVIGETGNAGQVAYAASKSGLFGLTKSLARELGSRSVTVNAVTPGYIETDMTAKLDQTTQAQILSNVPLGRLGSADDVAELVIFLASPGAGYITGQVIGVNGGMRM